MNGLLLFSHVNYATTAFSNLLQQFVAADSITNLLADRRFRSTFHRVRRWFFQKISGGIMCTQQTLYSLPQICVFATGTFEECEPLRHGQLMRFGKQDYVSFGVVAHDIATIRH